jgi:23S rRNA (pseudouridine1915-N3)-methyltransferase
MKIKIFACSKTKEASYLHLEHEYLKRLKDWKVEIIETSEKELPTKITALKNTMIIALDEHGQNLTSHEFAALFKGDIAFVIGAADGLPAQLLEKADKKLAFGKLTYPHKMVRVMLTEQIYRAWSIKNNHPYHRE